MTALNRKLFRDIIHLRGQLIAAALVVACGIAAYVTMRSAYDSLLTSQRAYYTQYRFADVFAGVNRAPEGLADRIRQIPGVAAVDTRIVVNVTLDVPGLEEPATGHLVSMPERPRPVLNDVYIRKGRYFDPGRTDEVIISEAFAEANKLNVGQQIGAVVNGRWKQFEIVGVGLSPEFIFEISPSAFLPDNRRYGVLWVSRSALSAAFDMEGAFNDVSLTLAHGADEQEVIARLDRILKPYGAFGAYGRPMQTSHNFISSELEQLEVSAVAIPIIFLGVAAFLLHIVLSRLVRTQREQVAVLKAFGYSNGVVGLHYLGIALASVLAGGVVGIGLGMWAGSAITEVYTQFYRFPILRYTARFDALGIALLIGGGSAVIGAISAARGAMKLPPAEAMRPEPPARFKPGLLERIGFQRLLSTGARMVLRSLERNPMKAFLSTLGIAMSVAILIVGRFSFDAMEAMMDTQFSRAQREDATVVFNQPRTGRARFDLYALPGVMRAEPFRTVPVEVSFRHRRRRLAVTGLEPNSDLRRIVDAENHVHPVPPAGVLISSSLGRLLGVSVGDTITVEALEGRRPTKRLAVAGMAEELMGLSIYMRMDALNQMMEEGEVLSGAYMMVDQAKATELNDALKQTPAVAGTAFKDAMLKSFADTIAASQAISRNVLIFFACVIAVGVLYNSARISLSERGRELASLRVLGFKKSEVAMLLLGEQAVLTLFSLPLGSLIGYGLCAALAKSFETEVYRFPLMVSMETYTFSALVVIITWVGTAFLVRRRIYRLDLIEVLKTRE